MSSVSSYPAEYVATCRAAVRGHLDQRDRIELSASDRADAAVLGRKPGEPITVDAATFRRLAEAFFDEIENRFPG